MPKLKDIKKVLVIGSGPIIIGQAAEFDYAGTQACRALKEEGLEVVLVNSNPATIMTDVNVADRVYVEPILTRAKEDTTHSRRVVFGYLQDKQAVTELFKEISTKIADRPGGYTRIIKLGSRQGDAASMAFIELVDYDENMMKTEKKAKRTRRGGAKKAATEETPATETPAVEEPKAEEAPVEAPAEESTPTEEPAKEETPAE